MKDLSVIVVVKLHLWEWIKKQK